VYKQRLGLMILLLTGVLVGCIQPDSTPDSPTATAPAAGVVNPPMNTVVVPTPTVGSVAPPPVTLVDQFLQQRGETASNLQIWYDQPQGPDQLQGFSYTNASGLPCAGWMLTALIGGVWQINNGALLCPPQPGLTALASVSLFATTDGQPYTIVFGRIEDPTITAIAIVYSDASSDTKNPALGGFLAVRSGILSVNTITAIDQLGNTVITNIPQSPSS